MTPENLRYNIYTNAAQELKKNAEEGGFHAAGKRALEEARIVPVYTLEQQNFSEFDENRKRLNKEAGLVISNHPGYFDTFLILNALKRKDVKIVISAENYETYAPLLGSDAFIKAGDELADVRALLDSIKTHIENGGLVMLYPSGGADRVNKEDKKNEELAFKSGFAAIVKKCLKPTDMIYSFHINTEDIEPIINETVSRHTAMASALATHPALNVNALKDDKGVRVDEKYSTAEEWQALLGDTEKAERNKILTDHYSEQF